MGMKCTSCKSQMEENIDNKDTPITKRTFKLLFPIGKGGFGKVWKVTHKQTSTEYAMKEISKVKLYINKSIPLINQELLTLKSIHNFFISNIHYAFQTEEYLYIITDYFPGGDLRYHINNRYPKRFTQNEIKFILGCIILALVYLRKYNIIHRDIKPDNLVFDSKGYLHLTDFGVSKRINNTHHNIVDKSGTIGYASPEAVLGLKQSYTMDYFALGVIAYELLVGCRPFRGRNKHQIKEQMITKTVQLKPEDIVHCSSNDNKESEIICDFVNSLLQRKVHNRLGSQGIEDIIYHPFFDGFDWNALYNQQIVSPFQFREGECYKNIELYNDVDNSNGILNTNEYYDILNRINNNNKCFVKFYYDSRHKEHHVNKYNNLSTIYDYECFQKLKNTKRNSGVSLLSTKSE